MQKHQLKFCLVFCQIIKWEEAADILPVAVLEFLPLLVFLVVFVSVFLVFVLVFMFVSVCDTKERSTCSAALGKKKKKKFLPNVYIWESSFYIRLPTLVDLEVPFVCSSRMLTQADREGKKKHPPHFFYISPCCWKSHSNYCPSVSHISCSWPQSPWRSTSIFILQGTPAWGVLGMVFLYLRICHNITVIFKTYPHNIHLLKYATQK